MIIPSFQCAPSECTISWSAMRRTFAGDLVESDIPHRRQAAHVLVEARTPTQFVHARYHMPAMQEGLEHLRLTSGTARQRDEEDEQHG